MICICLNFAIDCEPVGVADTNKIPDANMTSSSYYVGSRENVLVGYYPYMGRLHGTRTGGDDG